MCLELLLRVAIGRALVPFFATSQCMCIAFASIGANVCFGTCVIVSMSFGMSVTITCTCFRVVATGHFRLTCAATSGFCVLTTFSLAGLHGLSNFGSILPHRSNSFFSINCTSFSGFCSVNCSLFYRGNCFRSGLCSSKTECAEQGKNGQELLHVIRVCF